MDPARFALDRELLTDGGPPTRWGNLGLWDDGARSYAEACEALARAVGSAARIGADDRVLEAACGAGEGLALWVRGFGAAHAAGVEIQEDLVREARAFLASNGLSERAVARAGSATSLDMERDASFSRVVCVDAAYHFSPRARFFAEARRVLERGGRIALTDLILDERHGARPPALLRAAAAACAVPVSGLLSATAYRAELEGAGFANVTIDRLDARVFEGFASFVFAQASRLGLRALSPGFRKPLGASLLARAAKRAGLGYALVTADADRAAKASSSRNVTS